MVQVTAEEDIENFQLTLQGLSSQASVWFTRVAVEHGCAGGVSQIEHHMSCTQASPVSTGGSIRDSAASCAAECINSLGYPAWPSWCVCECACRCKYVVWDSATGECSTASSCTDREEHPSASIFEPADVTQDLLSQERFEPVAKLPTHGASVCSCCALRVDLIGQQSCDSYCGMLPHPALDNPSTPEPWTCISSAARQATGGAVGCSEGCCSCRS